MRKRPFINIHLDMWQSLLDVILARPVVQYSNTLHNTLPATSCYTRWPLSNLFAQIFVLNIRYFYPHILKFSPLTTNAQCYNIFYWRWPLSNLFAQIFVFNTRYSHPHILKFSPLTTNAQCYNIFYWRMVPPKQFYK